MQPFQFSRAKSIDEAVSAAAAGATIIAGGTTLVDLMQASALRPSHLIDINGIGELRQVSVAADEVVIGALALMADIAAQPELRTGFPALTESLELAASPQLRNMATAAGNLLQRTRCAYYRDPSWSACNRRAPGSGCSALDGVSRGHAVLGTSERCIATYPGDWAAALVAFDAELDIAGPAGGRRLPFRQLHRLPGDAPEQEHVLEPGAMITAIRLRRPAAARASTYVKVRDRASFQFANAGAAVGLELDGGAVGDIRIGLSGVATIPWRAEEAEELLRGKILDEEVAHAAAARAFAEARTTPDNAFKVPLGIATIVRALLQAKERHP